MNRERLLVVTHIAGGGGVNQSFLSALTMLAMAGHEPVALAPEGFRFADAVRAAGHELALEPRLDQGGSAWLPWQAARIAAIAKAAGASRILLNNGRHVWWVKRFTRLPVVVVYHGGKLSRVLQADAIVTINEPQRAELIAAGFPRDRVAVVDNVYPEATLPPFEARPRREPLRIGTLRLLEPAKGVDVLVAAAVELVRRGHDVRVEIGSEGTQRAALEAQVRAAGLGERVTFHGWVADRPAFYRGLDIYVLPSRFEEWGIGILEAWAMSLPVVATACLGPKRIVADGRNGLLAPVGEPRAMADAIERLIADPALAAALAAEGRREAERYTMARIAPTYAEAVARWGVRA